VSKNSLIKNGVCEKDSDCVTGTCVEIVVVVNSSETNFEEDRKYCKCSSDNVIGQFCEYKKDEISEVFSQAK
jgi:hypothetical protein